MGCNFRLSKLSSGMLNDIYYDAEIDKCIREAEEHFKETATDAIAQLAGYDCG